MYQFILWLVPAVDRFPRAKKFLRGERMQSSALDLLVGLVEIRFRPASAPSVAGAAAPIDTVGAREGIHWPS